MSDWRDIPNYDGVYQINREGQVRSWHSRRGERRKTPKILTQTPIKTSRGRRKGVPVVSLTDKIGRTRPWQVFRLMVMTWFNDYPEGVTPYHKNGDIADNFLSNIGFTTKSNLGKISGGKNVRKPVVKIDRHGEVIAFYKSATAAAKANFMSDSAVRQRCLGKIKKPFEPQGYSFRYDD